MATTSASSSSSVGGTTGSGSNSNSNSISSNGVVITAQHGHELSSCASDGIGGLRFAHHSDMLLVSSWDRSVRLYDTSKSAASSSSPSSSGDQLTYEYKHRGAVLDCAWNGDDTQSFAGGLDKQLIMCDLKTGETQTLGSHNEAIKCVNWSSHTSSVATGSWDCSVKLWDSRQPSPLISTSILGSGSRVYTMDIVTHNIVVGTSDKKIYIYDSRNMSSAKKIRDSPILNQTRCIRNFPDASGYVLSSIEGRVAIDYFDDSPAVQSKKYAFKCHRKTVGNQQLLYPVNAIAFHPRFGTFVTGGCDGNVVVWDAAAKKRVFSLPTYPTSIANLAFNTSGTLLAIASSYTHESGEKDPAPRDSIFIRNMSEGEVRTKSAASAAAAAAKVAPTLAT